MADVKVNLRPLIKFKNTVAGDLRLSGNGPIRAAVRQWGARYREFAQTRFVRFSRGGGDWPQLKRSTLKARRRGKGRARGRGLIAAILRDTSTLFAALNTRFTRKPGQIQEDIPFGVRVGFGGSARHPTGRTTVADIAEFHQTGGGSLPKREIIVDPDQRTVNAMAEDMTRALHKAAN